MCSQNARNVISEALILKIFWGGACPQTPLRVTKFKVIYLPVPTYSESCSCSI